MRGISGVGFSPDDSRLAADGDNGTVNVWNVQDGREAWGGPRKASRFSLSGLAYRPDGRYLALGDYAGTCVHILDAATGSDFAVLSGQKNGGVNALAYRPDGQALAAACADQIVRVWDPDSRAMQTLRGHEAAVSSVAYRSDGRFLASGGDDGLLILWDARAAKEIKKAWMVRAHRDAINAGAFSSDGRRLAPASRDGTVKLWDAATGRRLGILHARQGNVSAVLFHPNDKTLASAGADGTVKIWEELP
jgi:WD40 repeat protein